MHSDFSHLHVNHKTNWEFKSSRHATGCRRGAMCEKAARNANWNLHMVLTIFYVVHWPQGPTSAEPGGGALSQTTIKVSRDNTLHNTTILCCLTYAGWDYKSNFWMIWLRATELSNFARWIVAHICDRTNLREWFNPWIFKKPAVNFLLTTGTTINWMIGVKTKNYYAKKQNELVVQNIICTHVGVVFFMICI